MYHVLYIDNDLNLLSQVKLFLERSPDFIVDTVSSVPDVLTHDFLLTSDVIIWGFDLKNEGISFLTEIRTKSPHIPIILFSRELSAGLLIEAIHEGGVYVVQKGPKPENQFPELTRMVRMAIEKTPEQNKTDVYKLLFRSSPTLMALFTLPDRTFFDVNEAFLTSLGYTRKEVIGKTDHEISLFVNPQQADFFAAQVERKKQLNSFEVQVRGKGEIILEALLFADILPGQDQEYMMVVFIDMTRVKELEAELKFHEHELIRYSDELSNDIVERKRVEALLREKSEELDRYFTTALDLLCIANTKGEFVRVNPEWERVLGYSVQELEGRLFLDFIHPDDLEKTLTAIQKLAGQDEITSFENRYLCKDGSYRWIEWRSKPIGDMIYAAARDVTDRKLAEEALRKANRQINLLTSITRHDINNLLSVIYAYLALAEPHIQDPVLLEYFKQIESETKGIQSQIAFTSTYQILGSQNPIWQNIDSVLSRLDIPEHSTMHSEMKGIEIYADPILEKVFFNLLDNSLRHGEHVTDIRIFSIQGDDQITIIWEDNGVGIIPEEKEDIFKRGFGKNTGLGMFLVREILMLTEISIRETGEHGKGARFEIIVPKGKFRIRP